MWNGTFNGWKPTVRTQILNIINKINGKQQYTKQENQKE